MKPLQLTGGTTDEEIDHYLGGLYWEFMQGRGRSFFVPQARANMRYLRNKLANRDYLGNEA